MKIRSNASLTLKTDNADLTNNDWMGLIDAGIQLSYLSDVEDAIKQALQLDELRVYSGSLQSGIGFSVDAKRANEVIGDDRRQYNWLVAKVSATNFVLAIRQASMGKTRASLRNTSSTAA